MGWTFGDLKLVITSGDIAHQADVDAVVNAANAQLRPGGGVAGAIHRAAGPGLDRECRPLAPICPGEAVITSGHSLPNDYVIHCLGPVYGHDKPSDRLLADCYRNALRLADENQIESIAFPSISTGVFGYPMQDAARIAFRTVVEEALTLRSLKEVRFVLFGEEARRIHEQELVRLTAED
jgi:O-acetyl-ADP-ribose deacetylase (regulator of RNase III)